MKRVMFSLIIVLLIPGVLLAAEPTMGVYFNGFLRTSTPVLLTQFYGRLYICQDSYYVTAVEYALYTPSDPLHTQFVIIGVDYPDQQVLNLGDPWTGHSITYYPPLTGYPTGCDRLCTYTCMITVPCMFEEGGFYNYPLDVGPHPDTGMLRGTYSPNAQLFDITGLRSLICVIPVEAEESSWGAIKSMSR
ncbi:MAG: hypothetical protein JXB45_00390 [Candidatus Krumholzibacteriota bacterium]|nr:hypothetical protein [Candidatus Krumholzibacteriota bacterium]